MMELKSSSGRAVPSFSRETTNGMQDLIAILAVSLLTVFARWVRFVERLVDCTHDLSAELPFHVKV
jgi:hypothetical protein